MSGRGRGRGRGSIPLAAPGSINANEDIPAASIVIDHANGDARDENMQEHESLPQGTDANMQEQQAHNISQVAPPVNQALPPVVPANLDLQTIISAVVTAINQANDARFAALEARVASQADHTASMNKLDEILLRQLSQLEPFTGTTKKPWSTYVQDFRNKASQIPSLPKSEWLRYLHSRVSDRALEYAKIQGLVGSDDALICEDFELYCTKMGEAMFGDDMTPTQRVQALASMKQTGKYSAPLDFLRGKEQLLNQIPSADMAGYVRAALTLQGMDPTLVQAITPNPAASDGQFHSYAEVRKQVVAVTSLNQQLLAAAAQNVANNQNKASGSGWQNQKYKGKPSYQNNNPDYRYASNHSQQQQTQAPSQGPSQSKKQSASQQPEQQHNKNAAKDSSKQPVKMAAADAICKHCFQKGHFSNSYFHCPKNHKNKDKSG